MNKEMFELNEIDLLKVLIVAVILSIILSLKLLLYKIQRRLEFNKFIKV